MAEKPILFNTDMVRAIAGGRKTVTRRLVNQKEVKNCLNSPARLGSPDITDGQFINLLCEPPAEKGDLLYVRETWQFIPCIDCNVKLCTEMPTEYEVYPPIGGGCFVYYADYPQVDRIRWRPSIHMPKPAARLWLRVIDVRAERLQDINAEDALKEGVAWSNLGDDMIRDFSDLWDSTLTDKKGKSWAANPWVWRIEFEVIVHE